MALAQPNVAAAAQSDAIDAIDRLDAGMDLLLTAQIALLADGWVDEEVIEAVRNTIGRGLDHLRAARSVLHSPN
ncbi:hypothetical protein [Kaistia adipata]|uniref:hypothetical protein n=1 Tax=Kaistia adipata TaxID=166954 RepID=UPI0012EC17E9|nr:hypothetical protein [Kaistia adipata]